MSIGRAKRFRILVRDNFRCQYCGRRAPEVSLEVDHRLPRSAGGSDDERNLATACFDCNRGKKATFDTSLLDLADLERMARQRIYPWQAATLRDLIGTRRR